MNDFEKMLKGLDDERLIDLWDFKHSEERSSILRNLAVGAKLTPDADRDKESNEMILAEMSRRGIEVVR